MHLYRFSFFCFLLLAVSSCKKEEQIVFDDNTIPDYNNVPTLLVENYVNKLYIDLIGREPTDTEMAADVATLEAGALSAAARALVVNKLMYSIEEANGTPYTEAYFRKLYNDQKSRFLDAASEQVLESEYGLWRAVAYQDSLNGNLFGYEIIMMEANKVLDVLESRLELQNGTIQIDEMCRRMMYNSVYDDINMGSFNFINASFDDSFSRFPTQAEFDLVYNAIESNSAGVLFGTSVNNKVEYLQTLVANAAYDEGMIRWAYQTLLSREATSSEVFNRMSLFGPNHAIQAVQLFILSTDEYAGF
jgi:hypothetical protein